MNPEKKQGLIKNKEVQVEMSQLPSEDKFSELGDESGFLSDFGLSQVGSTAFAPEAKNNREDTY